MFVVTTDFVPGYRVKSVCGLAMGNTVRAKHIGRDFMASLKGIVGGELKGYTELLQESRNQAIERMVVMAQQLGANAVVNLRMATSEVAGAASEILCYGTAVVIEPDSA